MRPAVLDGAQAFFLDSPGQGRHPPPRLSGELSLVDTVGWSGVLSLTLQAPPELLSLLTAGGGENPSLAVCFAGTCASPSVLGAHLPFFKDFGRKLLPLHLSSFVAAALKKIGAPFSKHWGEVLHAFTQCVCHLHRVLHVAFDPEPLSQTEWEVTALTGLSSRLSSKV